MIELSPERMASMVSRRTLALTLLGTCVLSAAIGAGVVFLAKEGPAGDRGPRGYQGAEGQPGESAEDASHEAAEAIDRINSVESELSEIGGHLPAYGTAATEDEVIRLELNIAEVSGEVELLSRNMSELCRALELVC